MDIHKMRKWFERRFWDFRYGHGTYLGYGLGLFNFIVINYSLLISNIPFLSKIFRRLWIFGIVFVVTYFPLATIVGWKFFRKRQFKTDAEVARHEDPFRYKALVPSRETILGLPMQKLNITLIKKIGKELNVLTEEEEKQFDYFLGLIDKLMKGESLDKN